MIVVAGEALIDQIRYLDGRLVAIPGGGPFNTARTIGRLGGVVAFAGYLSTDAFGTDLRAALAVDGVDLSYAVATHAPTTLAVADMDPDGTATYRFETAGTAAPTLTAPDVRAALSTGPEALHAGTLGLVLEPMASALAEAVAGLGPKTLLMVDPNCRPPAIPDREAYLTRLRRVLARADVVKVSTDDLAYLAPGRSAVDAARDLMTSETSVVLLTDGGRPVQVIGRGFEMTVPVPFVPVVDTVGSGDAFGGGFLARWIERGLDRAGLADRSAVIEAATRAIEVAAATCQRVGADPPTRAELDWPAA